MNLKRISEITPANYERNRSSVQPLDACPACERDLLSLYTESCGELGARCGKLMAANCLLRVVYAGKPWRWKPLQIEGEQSSCSDKDSLSYSIACGASRAMRGTGDAPFDIKSDTAKTT